MERFKSIFKLDFLTNSKRGIYWVCLIYLVFSSIFATVNFDTDEFSFIREPYEVVGGDYTINYLKEGEYNKAIKTVFKSYYFFWKYRPLFSPIISEEDQKLFTEEESRFGYVKPNSVENPGDDPEAVNKYQKRLIVPEPDRFYSHGAGKPLLPAILSIPQLALLNIMVPSGGELLRIQFNYNYHPLFIFTRLIQIISGLVCILIIYAIVKKEFGADKAALGAAIFAFLPVTIKYFPNLHHDSIMIPFLIGAAYLLFKGKYIKGGLVFGLALASKNTAVFLIPALVLYFLVEGYRLYQNSSLHAAIEYLKQKAKELVIFGAFSLLTLLPFSHPISYVNELLTPITHREYDPRGQDVSSFTLSGRLDQSGQSSSQHRSEIQIIRFAFGYYSVMFFFFVLAFFLCLQVNKKPIASLAFIMLMFVMPYGLIFEYELNYRMLMFLPFFSLLCIDVLHLKNVKILVYILFLFSIVYCIDPITTDTIHFSTNGNTLFESVGRWFSD